MVPLITKSTPSSLATIVGSWGELTYRRTALVGLTTSWGRLLRRVMTASAMPTDSDESLPSTVSQEKGKTATELHRAAIVFESAYPGHWRNSGSRLDGTVVTSGRN